MSYEQIKMFIWKKFDFDVEIRKSIKNRYN